MCAAYCCTLFMTIDSKKWHITAERSLRQQFAQLLQFTQLLHFVDQENAQLVIGKTQNLYLLCVFIMSPVNSVSFSGVCVF